MALSPRNRSARTVRSSDCCRRVGYSPACGRKRADGRERRTSAGYRQCHRWHCRPHRPCPHPRFPRMGSLPFRRLRRQSHRRQRRRQRRPQCRPSRREPDHLCRQVRSWPRYFRRKSRREWGSPLRCMRKRVGNHNSRFSNRDTESFEPDVVESVCVPMPHHNSRARRGWNLPAPDLGSLTEAGCSLSLLPRQSFERGADISRRVERGCTTRPR
jgi:hypothetical protein